MANIVEYLEKILSSRYGEDVRGSIHDSIKAINDEVIDYGAEAGLKAAEAAENANRAKTYAESAEKSKESAQISANLTLQNLAEVKELAREAKTSAEDAETQAELSRSYAVGTNGEAREGDEQDNAKYYKEQAELNSASALQSANLAVQKAHDASLSETNAQQYALNAASSEANAKASEENAKNSEENALKSASDAQQSAVNSENSAAGSAQSAESALKSAENAHVSESAAKGYAESAAESAARAEQVSDISFATQEKAGIVKPDGITITVDEDGTLHGANTVEVDGQTIEKTQDNVLKVSDTVLSGFDGLSDQYNELSEYVNNRFDAIEDNFGTVDNELNKLKDSTETTFDEETERKNIVSGEKLSKILGKIKKWFSDLKSVAFTGSYNDLSNKPTIPSVGNGTVKIMQNGVEKGSFSMNQSGNAIIELSDTNTDTNTWRPVQDNLSSNSTTDSLSANMGRSLANGSARDSTKLPLSGGTITGNIETNQGAVYQTDGNIKMQWANGEHLSTYLSNMQNNSGGKTINSSGQTIFSIVQAATSNMMYFNVDGGRFSDGPSRNGVSPEGWLWILVDGITTRKMAVYFAYGQIDPGMVFWYRCWYNGSWTTDWIWTR